MKIASSPIEGVLVVTTRGVKDERGAFTRFFCEEDLAAVLGGRRIVQINHSRTSAPGSVRGMHYQAAPHAEMKLVRCTRGRVWDVAVDLRAGSATFLHWHAQELSADNELMFVIPEGCAHGFQVLEPGSELLYLHTAAYCADAERGVDCRDPRLAIEWPLPVIGLSARDASHPAIEAGFRGLNV